MRVARGRCLRQGVLEESKTSAIHAPIVPLSKASEHLNLHPPVLLSRDKKPDGDGMKNSTMILAKLVNRSEEYLKNYVLQLSLPENELNFI